MVDISAEGILPSGRTAEKLSLSTLRSKMKCDPEGYEAELNLVYSQFKSSVELFEQQASLSFTSLSGVATDPSVAKDLWERAEFLANVAPFYHKQLALFPNELLHLLNSSSKSLPSDLRVHLTQALIALINRKIIDHGEILALFIELQTLGDKTLRDLAFKHVVRSISRMNQKKDLSKNRPLQNILFSLLQQEDEAKARRSLITLCQLHRKKVWPDERTANAICEACFHASSRIMISALSFLLDCENTGDDDDDSDDSSSEEDMTSQQTQVVISKEAVYKANHKGTKSSKKKKQAKLQRVMRSMKKQQRLQSEDNNLSYYSPLNHLKDPQGFVEKLFARLKTSNERFEVKMMMLKVIARTVGLHQLILLNFYPYIQRYVQPHQRDVTNLLAAAVQACHEGVPPDAVEPLFRQIVNQFVHDRSRPEAISVGLNVVREICLRIPLLMTEDLLQDLVLYKKSNEKAVSSAARSLMTLFREVCPSLLTKKDRGRPTNPKARPKAFGEVDVASSIPGIELLEQENDDSNNDLDEEEFGSSSDDDEEYDKDIDYTAMNDRNSDADDACELVSSGFSDDHIEYDNRSSCSEENESSGDDESDVNNTDDDNDEEAGQEGDDEEDPSKQTKAQKRKFSNFDEQLNAASKSLRALKKLTVAKVEHSSDREDGILSNEDFQRIKKLKAKEAARIALSQHGFKIPSSDQLSRKRVDANKLEANIKKKLTKEEKLDLVRAGREDRGKYQARTALKKKKSGGLSNRQKEHKKAMPIAAKRAKVAKSRQEKKRKQSRAGKQFRGRKAWK